MADDLRTTAADAAGAHPAVGAEADPAGGRVADSSPHTTSAAPRRDRLNRLADYLSSLADGRPGDRLEPSAAADGVDAVIRGVNLLADELAQVPQRVELRVVERTAELVLRQKEFERLALTDPLTGLANRHLLDDRIGLAVKWSERGALPPALLLIDLDEFKFINDTLGHGVGDAVLIEIAQRLRTVVRDTDTIGRLGGDEFAVVLPDTTEDEAFRIARRTLRALERPLDIDGREVVVTASIGLRFGLRGQSGDTLLRDADTAMYQAKALGRSNVQVFEPSMHHASEQRMEILTDLTGAIERDELSLLYQPIVSFTDRSVIGAEALLRWDHATNGLTLPSSFITIAEDSGLIADLGRWSLVNAIRTVEQWLATLPAQVPFTVHVNISSTELRRPGLVEFVAATLADHGVPAARLALEIAEPGLLAGDVRGLHSLAELRRIGVSVQIDDFGTGSTSIATLRDLPVDTVKIDRSVITDIVADDTQRAFVTALLGLIESVSLNTVVEGIETESQLAALVAMGARTGQGYLFGRPMSEADLADLLRRSVSVGPPSLNW